MGAWMGILAVGILVVFVGLDLFMVISLAVPGDERRQMIVWKASTFTLLAVVMGNIVSVVESVAKGQEMTANPFIQLTTAAIIYCVVLLFFKRRHGG